MEGGSGPGELAVAKYIPFRSAVQLQRVILRLPLIVPFLLRFREVDSDSWQDGGGGEAILRQVDSSAMLEVTQSQWQRGHGYVVDNRVY